MKYKICISVDEETLLKIKDKVRSGRFRNRSHAFEYAIQKEFSENRNPAFDTGVEE
jgi:Arc/MetJ-type ribon-helix-helix transcriptional regulator